MVWSISRIWRHVPRLRTEAYGERRLAAATRGRRAATELAEVISCREAEPDQKRFAPFETKAGRRPHSGLRPFSEVRVAR